MALELKIPPPLVCFATAWVMHRCTEQPSPLPASALLISLLVTLALVHAAPAFSRFRRAGTTASPLKPQQATRLVTEGPYRWTRNPMYLALTFLLLAWASYLGSFWSFAGPLFFVAYITRYQIIPEEKALLALFGSEYQQYQRQVPRWL